MSTEAALDREEYVEQAYFFRVCRDRLAANLPAQEVLEHIHQEILTTTRLRFDSETATGALGNPGTGPLARVYYAAAYYDKADRLTATVKEGPNELKAFRLR